MSEGARRPTGVQQTQRRTWDKEAAAARFAEREAAAEEGRLRARKPPGGQLVLKDALSAKNLIQRDVRRELESRVGTREIVTGVKGGGIMCAESGAVLRDSHAYLDHINGRKQLAARGVSINRIEHASVKTVQERLAHHRKERLSERRTADQEWDARVKQAERDEAARRAAKKARKEKEKAEEEERRKEQEAEATDGIDPALAAMMGISGFGGSKKN